MSTGPQVERSDTEIAPDRRRPERQHRFPGGSRAVDPAPPGLGEEPPLTTRQCADWMGVTPEFIRGAITDGVTNDKGARVLLAADSARINGRRMTRIGCREFVTFLTALGWPRIPTC